MTTAVPVIDISPYLSNDDAQADGVVSDVRRACEEIGFLVVSGHGVSGQLIDSMRDVSRSFFDLPVAEKLRYRAEPGQTLGYVPANTEYLAATQGEQTPPDLKESFDIRRPDTPADEYYTNEHGQYFFRPYVWPGDPAGFEQTWRMYYDAMHNLSQTMMRIFAEALNLPRIYFDSKIDRSVDFLRVINYPAQVLPPAPGQLRAGAHTDYGTLTFVAVDDAEGGLQVHTKSGEWHDVPAIPGTFVVNIGDMMAQWTSGRWVSTLHRVVNPSKNPSRARRISVVFFQNPNYDTVIQPLPGCETAETFPAVTAGEWLRNKSLIAKKMA